MPLYASFVSWSAKSHHSQFSRTSDSFVHKPYLANAPDCPIAKISIQRVNVTNWNSGKRRYLCIEGNLVIPTLGSADTALGQLDHFVNRFNPSWQRDLGPIKWPANFG
jgi:hypothetical protein